MVRGIIDSAADTSTSGAVRRICSPTSWERKSYETVLRPGGRISICSRRIRILHIAMNEHGLFTVLRYQQTEKETMWRRSAPVVVLQDDVVFATRTRGRDKVDRLEIPNLLVRGPQRILELRTRSGLRRVCLTAFVMRMRMIRGRPTRLSTGLRGQRLLLLLRSSVRLRLGWGLLWL